MIFYIEKMERHSIFLIHNQYLVFCIDLGIFFKSIHEHLKK